MARENKIDMKCKTTGEGVLIFSPEGNLTREFRAKYPKNAKAWDDKQTKEETEKEGE